MRDKQQHSATLKLFGERLGVARRKKLTDRYKQKHVCMLLLPTLGYADTNMGDILVEAQDWFLSTVTNNYLVVELVS